MNLLMAADPATAESGGMLAFLVSFILPMGLLFLLMYFMLIRPQRKREKKIENMRSQLEVGDEIVTNGGIIGRVVSIQEDNVVIETGSDRSKVRIARWAIQQNNTVHDDTPTE